MAQTSRANAERMRRAAAKHEARAAELRQQAKQCESEHERWLLGLVPTSEALTSGEVEQ